MPFLARAERVPVHDDRASSAAWRFVIAADEPCFAGHFDGAPVLPGIAHVAVALEACALWRPAPPPLAGLDDLRFLHPLGPADACRVTLRAQGPDRVAFTIDREAIPASRGVLVFAREWPST